MSNGSTPPARPAADDAPYRDARRGIPERVADLVARMTLPEKVGQMLQLDARDGVREPVVTMHAGSLLHTSPDDVGEAHDLAAASRLGIPLLIADDCIHGHSFWPGATIFPTQLGMAASWSPELVERVARATAAEVAATGLHWTFSPVLDVARDLRWGRIDETFGEDPFLVGELGAAMVRGYQGGGAADPDAILATAKHFAGYSETQGGRDASEADLTQRKLRSWFLPPFERVAREGCAAFMLGYQAIDGVPVTVNRWMLDGVLRGEWGYTGALVTDWDNVGRMVWEQRIFPDAASAAAAAVRAGNDMIMTTPAFFAGAQDAVARGLLDEADIDRAVARILALKFRLGLFEDPRRPDVARQRAVVGRAEHTALNLEVARRSLVLLTNDGALPLPDVAGPRRIAVVGPNADDAQVLLGDWAGSSGQVDWMPDGHPREAITTVLDGLRALAPDGWEVGHARGADILTLVPDPEGPTFADGQPRPPIATPAAPDPELLAEATALAASADWVVAVVGDRIELVGEGRSTATLELFGAQTALLDALVATGTPVIVVVVASKPLVLPASAERAAAVVWAANPGMLGGRAVAELLLGLVEPSGRLPVSVPRHVGQQPTYYNQVRGQHGTRYADLTQEPAHCFGEGLSYTTVEYTDLVVDPPVASASDTVRLRVTVQNTGARPALETVQAYVTDVVTSVTWAERELKAFRQVALAPGERAEVELAVAVQDCTVVDATGRRVVEPGEFVVGVGPSSRGRDHLLGRFTVRDA
ncbi:exo-beta-d-1,3/1,6-glucosidase [Actinotalea fermentans]|uniref:beta-glucosidase n=1 Tax=Actinotalea fermentans TaxID=43671 RepID=A0A511Z1G9_9CELL|nr:glycoside hydrolase family 3 N-terminal domain-containing protein [Actinotalea fermentans]KGM17246.1 beta-D-glucosideglucohydrolase [Actinotalea fermentans ATCC 43279 = JCM 9966 = DSM 3133]GEN81216.1 glycosyl hydrolase [Actinotalea fermentans]